MSWLYNVYKVIHTQIIMDYFNITSKRTHSMLINTCKIALITHHMNLAIDVLPMHTKHNYLVNQGLLMVNH